MEEKREPLSEMAIERKIQILRNKHMDSEVIALVKSDYEYGLTDDEIGLYLNKSYDIEQMKVLSKCLHKGVSEELLTLLKDSRMAAPKMQTALDYYEKGVPIDAIREVVQKDDTAVNMRRMFDVVLEKLNKAKEQMPQDLEYVKSLVAQMDEVVAKINHQNERYDALNKKLSEIEISKDDEEVRERLVKENQDKDALIQFILLTVDKSVLILVLLDQTLPDFLIIFGSFYFRKLLIQGIIPFILVIDLFNHFIHLSYKTFHIL